MNRTARQRHRLHAKDPRCFYCGVVTVLERPRGWRGVYPLLATIEHLRTRTDPNRREPPRFPNEPRHVLACIACNQARANAEPLEIRRALAVVGHIKHPSTRDQLRRALLRRGTSFER